MSFVYLTLLAKNVEEIHNYRCTISFKGTNPLISKRIFVTEIQTMKDYS